MEWEIHPNQEASKSQRFTNSNARSTALESNERRMEQRKVNLLQLPTRKIEFDIRSHSCVTANGTENSREKTFAEGIRTHQKLQLSYRGCRKSRFKTKQRCAWIARAQKQRPTEDNIIRRSQTRRISNCTCKLTNSAPSRIRDRTEDFLKLEL